MNRRYWLPLVVAAWVVASCQDESGSDVSRVSGDSQSVYVGAESAESLVVLVVGEDGSTPQAGVTVAWSVTTGDGTVVPLNGGTTTAAGEGSAMFTAGSSTGWATVVATAEAGARTKFRLKVIPQPAALLFRVSGDSQFVEPGADAESLVVRVAEPDGVTPRPGVTVAWAVTSGEGTVGPSSITDADGLAGALFTADPEPGDVKVQVSIPGGEQLKFTIKVRRPSLVVIPVSADTVHVVAGDTDQVALVVRVTEEDSVTPRSGVMVNWALALGTGTLTPNGATDGLGLASATFVPDSVVGRRAVTAGVIGGTSRSFKFDVVAPGPGVLQKVSGDSQMIALGASTPLPLTVRLLREDGVTLWLGASVTWTAVGGGGTLTPSGPTIADGLASATYQSGAVAGDRTVRATAPGGTILDLTVVVAPAPPASITVLSGTELLTFPGGVTHTPTVVVVKDSAGNPVPGVNVQWSTSFGGGTPTAAATITDSIGKTSNTFTLGAVPGGNEFEAQVGVSGPSATAHWVGQGEFTGLSGNDNVEERYSLGLATVGAYAYTGTWRDRTPPGPLTKALKIWNISGGGAPLLEDSVLVPGVTSITSVATSADDALLLASTEGGAQDGIRLYDLTDPAHPVPIDSESVTTGFREAVFADLGGARYIFAARNPPSPAVVVYLVDPVAPDKIVEVAVLPQSGSDTIHAVSVRDGVLIVSDWNGGVRLYDVGGGGAGGSPAAPSLLATITLPADPRVSCVCAHDAWWFHDPVAGQQRYLVVARGGPTHAAQTSSGQIHVIDISDLSVPVPVARFRLGDVIGDPSAPGPNRLRMDESRRILYAAYNEAGVVALDLSGDLPASLRFRVVARTSWLSGTDYQYVSDVKLVGGMLYATDMMNGFLRLTPP